MHFLPKIIQKVRAAIPTYQWGQSHVVLNFAQHLGYSESSVKRALVYLASIGEVEAIVEGQTLRGRPRIIYKIKNHEPETTSPRTL